MNAEQYSAASEASSAELPEPYEGYTMTAQYLDQSAMMGNISFTRPFEIEEPDQSMSLNYTRTYYAYLNWGVFDNYTHSFNSTHKGLYPGGHNNTIYGAKDINTDKQ